MELYELSNKNGTLTCSFYTKSKLSHETHGFSMTGKNVDNCINALAKLNVKSFRQINKGDLEVSYKKGILIIRDFEKLLSSSKFDALKFRINNKMAKLNEKKVKRLLTKHKEYKRRIVKKANKVKSVENFNKKATLSKKELLSFSVIDGKTVCTFAGVSKLTRQKFSYTYSGPEANKTLANVSKNKVKAFQNLDDSVMEIEYKKGKIKVSDFDKLFATRAFKDINSGIVKRANKLSHKEVRQRYLALNKQSKWVNRIRSLKNFGKKAVCGTTFCSFVLFGGGFGVPMPNMETKPVISNDVVNVKIEDQPDTKPTVEETPVVKEEVKQPVKEEKPAVSQNTNVYTKDYFEFNYGYRAKSADRTRELYQGIIDKYSKRYGVDANLMLAIGAHERGIHSTVRDSGGAIGLMQIQVNVWNGSTISVYNYETGQKEYLHITEAKLANIDFNIQVGCAIFQNNLKTFNYDVVAAVQAYNYGCGGVGRLIRNYGSNWLSRRDVVNGGNFSRGDHLYVEHVFSYIYEDDYTMKFQSPEGVRQFTISNKALETAKTR